MGRSGAGASSSCSCRCCCLVSLLAAILLTILQALLFSWHPCGFSGFLFEWSAQVGIDGYDFASLRREDRACLWMASVAKVGSHNWLAYLRAAKTMLVEVQSRYAKVWQDAPSYWLELEVAAFLHVAHVQFVSTGTAALIVALQTLGVGMGDEVVVPTYAWISDATAVTTVGAIPVMADIDETLGMSPEGLLAVITNRTKAVILVHMKGAPADVLAIKAITEEKGLALIEDNGFFGSTVQGRLVGTFGDIGVASVNPTRPLQAGGQGGLVWLVNEDAYLKERMRWSVENGLAAHGGLRRLPSFKRSFADQPADARQEEVPFAGHCFRSPSEWHASFLRHELMQVPRVARKLHELKKSFVSRFHSKYHGVLQRLPDDASDRSFAVTLLLRSQDQGTRLREHLAAHGVVCDTREWRRRFLPYVGTLMKKVSFHASGFPWLTEEERRPLALSQYDKSTSILNRSVAIPTGYYLTPGMMRFAADLVNQFLGELDQAYSCQAEDCA